jgi:Bacterial protein of unknown function (DUF922)
MNKYLILIITLLLSQPIFSQKKIKNDSICWSESTKLKWSDFKGKPRNVKAAYANMKASAFTYTNITASGSMKDDLPEFRILCRFVKSQSWVADSTQANIQQHEQLHFDIAELYARKIRKGIADLKNKKEKKMDRYSDLINKNLDELQIKNQEFDSRTIHGTDTEKEKAWEKDIAKELDGLKEFKSTSEMCGK